MNAFPSCAARCMAFSTLALLLCTAQAAYADLVSVRLFANTVYHQTSSSAPTSPEGFFFNVDGFFTNAGEFDSASVTYPGPDSPQSLTMQGLSFSFGSPLISTVADFRVAYPFGTYTVTARKSNPSFAHAGVIHYTLDAYTTAIPALSAATYNSLQGLNPAAAFPIAFNSFTPHPATNGGCTFFSIDDITAGQRVFDSGCLDPSTTSVLLPAHTLLPNTLYRYDLIFDNRIHGFDTVNNIATEQGFDVRTNGAFTTLPTEPVLILSVNAPSFRQGTQLMLNAHATPGLSPTHADVYIALQLPGCTSLACVLFWQGGLNFTATPQPLLRNWLISAFNAPIFSYTFGGTESMGSYVWLGAFVVPGTGNLIGEITQVPFTFSP